jgi:hypothetical protein
VNIHGMGERADSLKMLALRQWALERSFDVIGLGETGVHWQSVPVRDRLHERTRGWFKQLHVNHSYFAACKDVLHGWMQFGGTALLSTNVAAHRVYGKGSDPRKLGRWCWTRYRGKQGHTLRIILAYRPQKVRGPYTVYSQQETHFMEKEINGCPRQVMLDELVHLVKSAQDEGDEIMVMMDSND